MGLLLNLINQIVGIFDSRISSRKDKLTLFQQMLNNNNNRCMTVINEFFCFLKSV